MRNRRRRPSPSEIVALGGGRMVPERDRPLGEGLVRVKAGVVARLLGLRLLRLEADVVLAPVRFEPSSPVPNAGSRAQRQSPDARRDSDTGPQGSIAEAQHLLEQATRSLAEARKSTGPRRRT